MRDFIKKNIKDDCIYVKNDKIDFFSLIDKCVIKIMV